MLFAYGNLRENNLFVITPERILKNSRAWKARNKAHCIEYKRQFRWKYPERHQFSELRNRAKKRGIPFSLSFADFLNIIRWYPYFLLRNFPRKYWYTIDRINNSLGYSATNCQVLLYGENSSKRHTDVKRVRTVLP